MSSVSNSAFGRTFFVHLTRRDKVAQAVSYVKAQQNGLWHVAPDGTELERLSPPQELAYDASEIRTCLEEMTAHDHAWEHWFDASEIDPLRITYEELSDGPVETLRVMLGSSGVRKRGRRRCRTRRREIGGQHQSGLGCALSVGAEIHLSDHGAPLGNHSGQCTLRHSRPVL